MKKNVGLADKLVRVVLVLVIAALYLMGSIHGTAAIVLGILAAILLITSILSFCPLYVLLGISTIKKDQAVK